MDVLEALEDETLESHSRSPGFESLYAHKIGKNFQSQYSPEK